MSKVGKIGLGMNKHKRSGKFSKTACEEKSAVMMG
jgi:hypothetical protein